MYLPECKLFLDNVLKMKKIEKKLLLRSPVKTCFKFVVFNCHFCDECMFEASALVLTLS